MAGVSLCIASGLDLQYLSKVNAKTGYSMRTARLLAAPLIIIQLHKFFLITGRSRKFVLKYSIIRFTSAVCNSHCSLPPLKLRASYVTFA